MRTLSPIAFFLVAFLSFAPCARAEPPPPGESAMTEAVGAALQADMVRALKALRAADAADFPVPFAKHRTCMLERFESHRKPAARQADPFADRVVAAYRSYWRQSMLAPHARDQAEAALTRALRKLLGKDGGDAITQDALEPLVIAKMRRSGYYTLMGVTSPLRELMVWKTQSSKTYRVSLPEGVHEARVEFLDDFISLGWADYATCGFRGAGGWATRETLFAVVPRYKSLDDERFRVHFLAHETQHFADQSRFPGLRSWELEYRAKLAELAQSNDSRGRLLLRFTEDQGDDPGSPHSYANKRMLADLRARLGSNGAEADLMTVPAEDLRRAAVEALTADSKRREASVTPGSPASIP